MSFRKFGTGEVLSTDENEARAEQRREEEDRDVEDTSEEEDRDA